MQPLAFPKAGHGVCPNELLVPETTPHLKPIFLPF